MESNVKQLTALSAANIGSGLASLMFEYIQNGLQRGYTCVVIVREAYFLRRVDA